MRTRYTKTEQPALRGRDPHTMGSGESGTQTVARVMAKAEAGHARGSKTTESANFRLEPNRAKHTTEPYQGGGDAFTEGFEDIQRNAGQ